jgi:hypothetical protein
MQIVNLSGVTLPPAPTISSGPANPASVATATFDFSDTQAGVTFLCKVDSGAYAECSSGVGYFSLSNGAHTFLVEAQDSLGVSTPATYNWTVTLSGPPAPVITPPLVPASATAGSAGFTLTVNGTGFVSGAVVSFGGANKVTTFVSATQVTAAILATDIAAAGTPAVVVTNPASGGASNSAIFNVNNPIPVITPPLAPASETAGAAAFTLTVNGTGFVNGAVVSFGGTNKVTTFVSATQVTAAILATDIATVSTPAVIVTNPGPGGGASNSVNFNVTAANNPVPAITSLVPPSGLAGGPGFTLTVNGSNFVNGATATFGGTSRGVTFVNSGQITIAVQASDIATAGTPAVVVTNPAPGGGASNSVNFAVNNPVPVITPPLVPAGATAGSAGFTLTVNGTGFVNGAVVSCGGANKVTTFVSATQVTAAILAADIASVSTPAVVVTNPGPGGGASNSVNFSVTAALNPTPVITSLVPPSVSAGSGQFTLTVNGSGFINGSVVQWNASPRATTFVNSGQLTATITAADVQTANIYLVTVFNPAPGGGTSNVVDFTVTTPIPALTSLVPNSAIAGSPAFTLTVNGGNFINTSEVQWNGSTRATTFVNAGQLTASIAAADIQNVGTASVTVFTPTIVFSVLSGVRSQGAPSGPTSNPLTFTINAANPVPAITSLAPNTVSAGSGAFTLSVNGSNFINSSVVQWNGSARATTFVNAGQLTATITAADVQSVNLIPVTVFNPTPGGGTSNAINFNITTPVPALTSLVPNSATAGGAAFTLTLNGSNFVNSSVAQWNGSARATTFVNAGQLTASITAADILTAGTASVTVFTPTIVPGVVRPQGAPSGTTSNSLTFTINAANPLPTLTSLVPNSAAAGSAAFTLTLNGTNFISTSVVQWNGSARTTTFVNSGQVTAAITAADIASSGTASLTVVNPTPGGGTSNALTFTIADFSVANTSGAQTEPAGTPAKYTINAAGVGGNFPGTVTFSASGLPPLTTAGFVPQSVAPGAGTVPTTLTITTTARGTTARMIPSAPRGTPQQKLPQLLLWLGVAGLLGMALLELQRSGKLTPRVATTAFLVIAVICVAGFAGGCNGGFPADVTVPAGTPAGAYTITVTGTSGSVSHSTTVSLTVQ